MTSSRRSPDDWHALGQFCTQIAFAVCLVGSVFGVLYSLVFVTQPIANQAPNDAVLFEILKHVLTSMISIVGTLMAVGHGSNATAMPAAQKTLPAPVQPIIVPKPIVKPLSKVPATIDDDDEPPFKGAKE
jgi:hypothetical protein